jgi:hypothetical protein
MSSLSSSSTKTNRRERREKSPYFAGAKDGPLPELEVIGSLLLFHLDDERHDQHQEGGPGDLGHLARAAHQLLAMVVRIAPCIATCEREMSARMPLLLVPRLPIPPPDGSCSLCHEWRRWPGGAAALA